MAYKIGNVYFIAAIAVIGGGLFGFDISSMSATLPTQGFKCRFNTEGYNSDGTCIGPNPSVKGGIVSSMPAGSWLGAIISGFVSDNLGRKTSIQVGSVIWILGSIISCAAVNIPMLVAGRVINGISVGICSAQVPVYITEIAPPSQRGRLVGMQQWAITWGILIMFFVGYGASSLDPTPAVFQIPWGIQMVPGVCLFFGLMFLPESPRWLAKKDRWEEARDVLVLVHGHGDETSTFVARELAEIREVVEFERRNADVTYLELLYPRMINRTMIGIFTQIWSQLTGMNVMMYYITTIFSMTGTGGDGTGAVLLSSSIQFIINVVMTVPALLFMDRWGRRPMLLVGAALMLTWLSVNAGLLATYSRPSTAEESQGDKSVSMHIEGPPAKAVIAATYLFVASYAPTWGPVSWCYPPELYPLRVRGKAVALATSANWAFNFALAYFVPEAFANITWKTYVVFAVFCAAMFLHVFFMFPETANKPLEEVEVIFDGDAPGAIKYIGIPAWKTRNDRNIVRSEDNPDSLDEKLAVEATHQDIAN